METVLVVGIENVVGANCAAALADHYRVVGLSSSQPVSILGCETHIHRSDDPETIRHCLSSCLPDWVILCRGNDNPNWQLGGHSRLLGTANQLSEAAGNWAIACHNSDRPLTVISSDAVFTGPWMFHEEDGPCLCSSAQAKAIRQMEQTVLECHPRALIARTNAFGWSPRTGVAGWIETALATLETGSISQYDCLSHSTPILTTDLVAILEHAYQERLHGLYHVAGAERISPLHFVRRLGSVFGYHIPRLPSVSSLQASPAGFGRGESSLQTRRIRRALSISMPLLTDGLERLHQQQANGYRDRLLTTRVYAEELVA